MIRVIKSESDCEAALVEIEKLMDRDPDPGTPEGEKLELLSELVHAFESKRYSFATPDPIEAIRFRMEQENLKQRDLVPYIGSRSRVSEVLSRKRGLTLTMIRALHSGLGIPAEALLNEQASPDPEGGTVDWKRFPLREMIKRRWVTAPLSEVRLHAEGILGGFFSPLGSVAAVSSLYRRTEHHVRSTRSMDSYALTAWTAKVIMDACATPPGAQYRSGTVTLDFMRSVAQLSLFENGPQLAREFLSKHGIPLVILRHLPRTYLDGAAVQSLGKEPIIALTLRFDRIDNFWFCLMHELAHVSLHFKQQDAPFYDDLESRGESDKTEREADRLANEALIPQRMWEKSQARQQCSNEAVYDLARRQRIHPAIVAGRVRYELKSYSTLGRLLGHGLVRKHFPEFS